MVTTRRRSYYGTRNTPARGRLYLFNSLLALREIIETIRPIAPTALALTALLGCSTPFEVIEETEFAPELGIDLSQMQKLDNGVYIEDRVVGTGPEIVLGAEITVTFTGWLSDGTEFQSQTIEFTLIQGQGVISGLNTGLLGMLEGGTRLMVIPPEEAYGDREVTSVQGVVIPAGSILVMEVVADVVNPPA